MSDDFTAHVLSSLRTRMTGVFPAQIRRCLDELSEEELWMRPNEESNSVGNIVIHVSGSLNHFINRGIGGIAFDRDRPSEFAERSLSKQEVRERFEETMRRLETTFASLTPERLSEPSTEPKLFHTVFEDLLNACVHLANHAGQVVWITKSIRAGSSLGEIWMSAHKHHGGWRGPA